MTRRTPRTRSIRPSSRRGSTREILEEMKQRSNEGVKERGARCIVPLLTSNRSRLNKFDAGEEVADFEGGRFRGVGAVSAIVANAGAKVVANRAGGGFFRIGGAHNVAPLENGAFGFENHGEDFAGTHEVGQLAEEGARFVDGVEAAGFFFCQAHGFDGNDLKTGLMHAGEDLALLAATDGVGLDDCECAFDCHEEIPPKYQIQGAGLKPGATKSGKASSRKIQAPEISF